MGVKISELTAAGELDGTEVFPIVQSGSTVKTNIEAGAELDLSFNTTVFHSILVGYRNSDDQIRCIINWPEIPKQGTGLTITLPTSTLKIIDGDGLSRTISASHTISTFLIVGKTILFYINETGAFTTLNTGALFFQASGSGFKFTIT